jgi:hypothetical protein
MPFYRYVFKQLIFLQSANFQLVKAKKVFQSVSLFFCK